MVSAALAVFIFFKDKSQFRLSRGEIPFYLLYGLIGIGFFNIVWNLSVEVNRAAVSTALIFCSPVFVAIGARFLFKDRLKPLQYGAIALNLIGCGLVAGITDPAQLLQSPAGPAARYRQRNVLRRDDPFRQGRNQRPKTQFGHHPFLHLLFRHARPR